MSIYLLCPMQRPGVTGYGRLVDVLLKGEKLGLEEICKLLKVQKAAARRHRHRLVRLLGASIDAEKRVQLHVPASGPPSSGPPSSVPKPGNQTDVIALCLAASLRPLLEGTSYEPRLSEMRDSALAQFSRRGLRFEHLDRKFAFLRRGGDVSVAERGEKLDDLLTGLLRQHKITMRYEGYDGEQKTYHVAPLSLLVFDQQLYLLGRKNSGEIHSFIFARVLEVEDTKESFDYPEDFNPVTEFEHSFGIFRGEGAPQAVVLRVARCARAMVVSRRWHPSQEVRKLDDGDVIVSLRVRVTPELERWLLGFGEDAEVLQPSALRDKLANRLRACMAAYEERPKRKRHAPQPPLKVARKAPRA